MRRPNLASEPKMLHPEVSQDTASWLQTLKSLAWGLAGRGLAKEAILQFWGIPNSIPNTCAHMWHMLCEILDPCCLLVLYLLGRVLSEIAWQTSDLYVFWLDSLLVFWFLFQILWSVSPFSSSLSAACWFALWFQLCGQAIVFLASSSTWHEWFWWILWCSCAERWSFF